MKVFAFVGPSGTGKSHRAQMVARENEIKYIIDDAILICENKLVAGTSAKKAATMVTVSKTINDPTPSVRFVFIFP